MRDKKIQPKAIVLLIAAAIVVLAALTVVLLKDKKAPANNTQQNTSQSSQNQSATENVSYDGMPGKTALELLKTKASVVTKDSSFGEYVDSINGVTGGTDGKYWAFYVNGEMAQVGADAYETKDGDKIEWKFE